MLRECLRCSGGGRRGGTDKILCRSFVRSEPDVIIGNDQKMFDICKTRFEQSAKGACGKIRGERVFLSCRTREDVNRSMTSDTLKLS